MTRPISAVIGRYPVIGSDPGKGFVYVGQEDGPPYRLTLAQARDLVTDLLGHMDRAARGDEPEDGWPEERSITGGYDDL